MKIFSFEKLNVWQKSRKPSLVIYKITKSFPEYEKFGLVSQMRRAVVSTSSYIAQGSGRYNAKHKARFTEIAFGSALELLNQTILSNDLEYIEGVGYLQIPKELT